MAAAPEAGHKSSEPRKRLQFESLEERTLLALVAAYGFDEGSGAFAADHSGNGHHGSVSDAAWAFGRFGSAPVFDGVDSRVDINDSELLDLSGGMTLEAWVRPTAISSWRSVIIKERPGGEVYHLYANVDTNVPGVYALSTASPNDPQTLLGNSQLPLNTWTHLAATYDTSVLKLFINGSLAASRPLSGELLTSDGALRIGGNSIWGEYFAGRIDEVRIYNHALSQSEIVADMEASVTGAEQTEIISTPHDDIPDFGFDPTIVSVVSGDWSSPSTWSLGRTPMAGDVVSIAASTTVSYDVQSDARLQTIVVQAGGQLTFRTDLNTRVTVVNFMVLEGGELRVGTAANPVAAGVTAEIVFANQPLNPTFDPDQYGNGLIALGKVTMHGAVQSDTFVRLAGEPLTGQTTLTLETPVIGWRPGDRLGLPDTRHLLGGERFSNFEPQWERATIQSISPDGRVLDLDQPADVRSQGSAQQRRRVGVPTARGKSVAQRNDQVRELLRSARTQFFSHRADVDIRYVAFAGLGRTTNADLHPTTNHIGRYPVHFHHLMGPQTPQANGHQYTFVGNSIFCGMPTHNFKWAIAIHDSHDGLIKDNVLYNWAGAGIVTEDGNESFNVFEHNLVMALHSDVNPRANDGRDAAGFWFAGFNNYVRDNVVAGAGSTFQEIVSGVGYKYFMDPPKGLTDLTPILEFARNEAYGAMATGLTIWHLGTDGYLTAAIGQSTIRDFRVWHAWEEGVFAYPIQNVVVDGLVVRGDSRALNPQEGGAGWTSGDYWAGNVTIRRADIQGMYVGFAGSSNTPGVTRIEDSYFRNYSSNIAIQTLATPGTSASKPPRQTQIINTRFDPWLGAQASRRST